jgi:hypothetical protein
MKHLLLIILLLTAGTTLAQTPIEVNNKLAAIIGELNSKGKKWGIVFNEAYKSHAWSKLTPVREDMQQYVKTTFSTVQNMKDVKNSKPLRMAIISFLQYEQKMVTNGFMPFEAFNSETEPYEIKKAFDNLKAINEMESAMLERVADAAAVYAKENGFEVGKKKGDK